MDAWLISEEDGKAYPEQVRERLATVANPIL
jgi:hypothetical protein